MHRTPHVASALDHGWPAPGGPAGTPGRICRHTSRPEATGGAVDTSDASDMSDERPAGPAALPCSRRPRRRPLDREPLHPLLAAGRTGAVAVYVAAVVAGIMAIGALGHLARTTRHEARRHLSRGASNVTERV